MNNPNKLKLPSSPKKANDIRIKTVYNNKDWLLITDNSHNDMNSINEDLRVVKHNIINSYFDKVIIHDIDESSLNTRWFDLSYIRDDVKRLYSRYVRSIKESNNGNMIIRLECKDSSFYVKSLSHSESIPGDVFMIVEYNQKDSLLTVRFIHLTPDDYDIDDSSILDMIYPDKFCTSTSLSNTRNRSNVISHNYYKDMMRDMRVLDHALRDYMKATECNEDLSSPYHGKFEIDMIKKFLTELNAGNSTITGVHAIVVIGGWALNNDQRSYQPNIDEEAKYIQRITNQNIQYPIVDISEREERYIQSYCEKNGYKVDCDGFDLIPFLQNPRYGNILTFKNVLDDFDETNDDKKSYDITIGYDINAEQKTMVFRVSYNTDNYLTIMSSRFINIDNFNVTSNLLESMIMLHVYPNNIPHNENELKNDNPSMVIDCTASICMIWRMIMLMIVIQLRPERTRMVRITERKASARNKLNPTEKDFVVTRILKTSKDAKEYVKVMTESTGEHIDREYTLEEWTRIGHYRKTRDGKRVWIEPTTCHRRLPLTEKEIHIKL